MRVTPLQPPLGFFLPAQVRASLNLKEWRVRSTPSGRKGTLREIIYEGKDPDTAEVLFRVEWDTPLPVEFPEGKSNWFSWSLWAGAFRVIN